MAERQGIGKGEFAAWLGNMRQLGNTIGAIVFTQTYALCQDRGYFPGTVWAVAGFVGALLPQLICESMPKSAFESERDEKEPKKAA